MSAARTERLLNLLTLLLNTRRPISLRELREMPEFLAYCSVDPKSGERAFERDKAALIEAGVPIRWLSPKDADDDDGLGGYVVDQTQYYLPDMHLSPEDFALLSIAGSHASANSSFVGRAALLRALSKIGFDVDEAGAPKKLVAHTPLAPGLDEQLIRERLDSLHGCIGHRRQVNIVYESRHGEGTRRTVNPYGLYYRSGQWYLVGYCHLRRDERTFSVHRIQSLDVVRGQRGRGYFEVPATFLISDYARRRPWEYPTHAAVEVRLRLAPRLKPAVVELFGPHAELSEGDGVPRVSMQVTNTRALEDALLPLGKACLIEEPASLRENMHAIFEELAQCYRDSGDVV